MLPATAPQPFEGLHRRQHSSAACCCSYSRSTPRRQLTRRQPPPPPTAAASPSPSSAPAPAPAPAAAAGLRRRRCRAYLPPLRTAATSGANNGGSDDASAPERGSDGDGGSNGGGGGGGDGSGNGSGGGSNGGSSSSGGGGGGGDSEWWRRHLRWPQALPGQQLTAALGALAGLSAALLGGLAVQMRALAQQQAALDALVAAVAAGGGVAGGAGGEGEDAGLDLRESIAALKRLLREAFAEQLAARTRLDAAEAAAAARLEAGDDYALALSQPPGSEAAQPWERAPVRASGAVAAAGVVPLVRGGAADRPLLAALGAETGAETVLLLHSSLGADGDKKRRVITAELAQPAAAAAALGAMPALQLRRLLYRAQPATWLTLLVAPVGGGLDAVGPSLAPFVRGGFGLAGGALRRGHALTALDAARGAGKAVSVSRGWLSGSAGLFVNGGGSSGSDGNSGSAGLPISGRSAAAATKLQLRSPGGASLSVVASSVRARGAAAAAAPPAAAATTAAAAGTTVGVAAAAPLGDVLTATAWAEWRRCPAGSRGSSSIGGGGGCWGAALYAQPDARGIELGVAVGRRGAAGTAAAATFCEVAAKLPAGDGLALCPGLLLARRDGAALMPALVMASTWRF